MIKYEEGAEKKLANIRLGRNNASSVTALGKSTTPPEGIDKGVESRYKPSIQNMFTELEYKNFSTSSSQSTFTSAVDITIGG